MVARYLQNVPRDPRITEGALRAVERVESGGNPNAVSPAGAQGLMQLMPGTAKDLGVDPFDPKQAREGGMRYLNYLISQTGNLRDALASYNMGLGALKKRGMNNLPSETKNYVEKVMALMGKQEEGKPVTLASAPINQLDPSPKSDVPPDSAQSDSAPPAMAAAGSAGKAPVFSGYGKISGPPSMMKDSPLSMVENLLQDPLSLSRNMASGGMVTKNLPSKKHVPKRRYGYDRLKSSVAGPSVSDGDSGGGGDGGSLRKGGKVK